MSNGAYISLPEAVQMTQTYRKLNELILEPIYRNKTVLPRCETFDRTLIDGILQQQDCVGIRIYYGMDAETKLHAILVGVNSNNEDILPSGTTTIGDEGLILNHGQRCPNACPPPSVLNP